MLLKAEIPAYLTWSQSKNVCVFNFVSEVKKIFEIIAIIAFKSIFVKHCGLHLLNRKAELGADAINTSTKSL